MNLLQRRLPFNTLVTTLGLTPTARANSRRDRYLPSANHRAHASLRSLFPTTSAGSTDRAAHSRFTTALSRIVLPLVRQASPFS